MRHLVTPFSLCLLCAMLISLPGTGRVWAQDVAINEVSGTFTLSDNANYSSDERSFDREETLYIRLNVLAVDFTGLELNESKLTPVDQENVASVLGTFQNHFNGTYTLEINLRELPDVSFWTWTGIIADDNGRGFIAEAEIVLGPPDLESSELKIRGFVEAIGPESLVIHDQNVRVTRITSIMSGEGERLELDDLQVGDEIEADVTFNGGDQAPYTAFNILQFDSERLADVTVTGEIDELVDQTVVVNDLPFIITEATEIVGLDGEDVALTDFQPGSRVRLLGQFTSDGELIASLLVEVDDARGGFTLEGAIESLSSESLIVEGTFFVIANQTVFLDENGSIIPFASLQPGQFVTVGAQLGNDGLPVAISVKKEDGLIGTLFTRGSVDQIALDRIIVQGRDFTVNEETQVVDESGQLVSFNLVQSGLEISIAGEYTTDGQLVATLILLDGGAQDEIVLEGVITIREEDVIIVQDVAFSLTEGTIIVNESGVRLGMDQVVQGMFIEVVGSSADGVNFNAIKVEGEQFQIGLEGFIERSVVEGFYVGDIPFLVDEQTLITGPTGVPINLESILVGTQVHVEGPLVSADSLQGTSLDEEDNRVYRAAEVVVIEEVSEYISVVGVISSLSESLFTVEDFVFSVNDQVEVKNEQGGQIGYSDLEAGQVVEVQAVPQGDGIYAAFLIQERASGPVKVSGTIEAISGIVVSVSGVAFMISDDTEIVNTQGELLSRSDLMPGMLARVVLEVRDTGIPRARRMKVLQRIEDEVRVTGPIDAVLEREIVVLSRTFYVTGNTRIVDQNNQVLSLEEVSPDAIVRIRADLLPGDELVALKIRVMPEETEDIDLMGPVESMEGDQINILGIPFIVDSETQFRDVSGDSLAFEAVRPGNTVDLRAVRQDGDTPIVTSIRLRDIIVASGMITSLSSSQIMLLGGTYGIDENTLILDEENEHIVLEALEEGEFVEIRGASGDSTEANGSFLVTKIKLIRERQIQATSIEDAREQPLPSRFVLHQNYPNPFNTSTTILFDLGESDEVSLEIYSVLGQRIRTFQPGVLVAGEHAIQWDGTTGAGVRAASGIFYYRIKVGEDVKTGKMVMVK